MNKHLLSLLLVFSPPLLAEREVVRLGKEHGVAAPYNAKVLAAVHQLEQMQQPSFSSKEQVMADFRQLSVP